jgi:ectoine hydroxylase-related dioxygenase (phytanoyl-CoA dioxygenase family)
VGLDLHVQRYPYLRIARPGRVDDVTGMHRDLLYGASPYEVSLLVPFTELDAESALRVVSGSHVAPASSYPATRVESTDVTPGSTKHRLGFPYAPQVLAPDVAAQAEPVPLRVGQALLMSLGLVHGQEVNRGGTTRVTTDVRVVNSLAPVDFSRGVRDDYYEPLCWSPVTEQARRQIAAEG